MSDPFDVSIRVFATKDNGKSLETFDGAACDLGRLDHVVTTHRCMRTVQHSNNLSIPDSTGDNWTPRD